MRYFDCVVALVSTYPLKTTGGLFEVPGMEIAAGEAEVLLEAVEPLSAQPVSMTVLTMTKTAWALSFI